MTTHVAIGGSSWRDYQFLAPITALLWRERIGFEPIVLRIGDWEANDRGRVALLALNDHRIRHVQVTRKKYEEPTVAQNCRQFAAALDLPEEDWLIPADADLWPLKKGFYQQHEGTRFVAVCYYGNGDHYQTIPTCHVAMKVSSWRGVYGYGAGDDIGARVEQQLDLWLPNYAKRWPMWKDPNFALWMSDQAILSEKVRGLDAVGGVSMIERRGHPPVDRIDRSKWPTEHELDARWGTWTDAHLLRPADQPENWPRVRALFSRLLPSLSDWAEAYREAYLKGY